MTLTEPWHPPCFNRVAGTTDAAIRGPSDRESKHDDSIVERLGLPRGVALGGRSSRDRMRNHYLAAGVA